MTAHPIARVVLRDVVHVSPALTARNDCGLVCPLTASQHLVRWLPVEFRAHPQAQTLTVLFLPGVVPAIREGQLSSGERESVPKWIFLLGIQISSVRNPPALGQRRFHTNTDQPTPTFELPPNNVDTGRFPVLDRLGCTFRVLWDQHHSLLPHTTPGLVQRKIRLHSRGIVVTVILHPHSSSCSPGPMPETQ